MPLQTFTHRSTLPFPADEVFSWHLRPGALCRLIPPWRKVQVLFQDGGPNQEGARIGLNVFFAGLSWKWILEHRNFTPGKEFSDHQIQGPFSEYRHRHRVEPIDAHSCQLIDEVSYRLPCALSIDTELAKLFHWRHRIIKEDLDLITKHKAAPMRILLSGATGLIGRPLEAFLKTAGHDVVHLVRNQHQTNRHAIYWDPAHGDVHKENFEDFDAVIHLAGENIAAGRWSKKRKERLFLSRCRDSWLLSQVLSRLFRPPKTVICASALGYYGNRGEEELTEESAKGQGFLADLCQKWESSMQAIENRGARVVHTRFGIVLSASGGILQRSILPFKLGLGGRIGSGKQVMSWVGIDDVVGSIYHALVTESIHGPVNVAAPHPVSQKDFATALGQKLNRPACVPVPAWALRLILGEMADELLLSSARVSPLKLLETEYAFRYPRLQDALDTVM